MTVLDQVDAGFNLWDRYKRWRESRTGKASDNVASRFVRLFESHGIARNQIPRYLPGTLRLADVQSDDALIQVLDQTIIDQVADLFRINAGWLECAASAPYRTHDFYKKPQKFVAFIEELLATGADLGGLVFTSASPGSGHHADTFILLEETVDVAPGLPLTRYYILDNWFFNYGKSRAYLAACVAAAWRKNVYLHGRKVTKEFIRKYEFGESLFDPEIIEHWPGRYWHPDDMALDSQKLIEGLPTGHDKEMAVGIFLDLLERDDRFSLPEMESVGWSDSFNQALRMAKNQE